MKLKMKKNMEVEKYLTNFSFVIIHNFQSKIYMKTIKIKMMKL